LFGHDLPAGGLIVAPELVALVAALEETGHAVVIAGNQAAPAVQFGSQRHLPTDVLTKCEVPQVPDHVIRCHPLVPPPNQFAVHLVDACEGPLGVADDVGVREVRVAGPPDGHGSSVVWLRMLREGCAAGCTALWPAPAGWRHCGTEGETGRAGRR